MNSPWRTLDASLDKLSPGDILNLREGVYYESNISTGLDGNSNNQIIVQSYSGERAVVDGGLPDFRNAPNSEWELVDSDIHLYRSRRLISSDYAQAWVLEADTQLMEYDTTSRMDSRNYTVNDLSDVYSGPGVQLRNGNLYIRLELGPYDRYEADGSPVNFPVNPNPNNLSIAVYTSRTLLDLNGASYLSFRNIDFVHSSTCMEMDGSTHNITIDGCYIKHGVTGIGSTGASNCEILNSEFNGGIPRYFYWTDLKDSSDPSEAGPEFQTWSIVGTIHNFDIHHNTFRDLMDAMNIGGGSSDVTITQNLFKETSDDALNFQTNVSNIEVSRNMFWHVLAGIAILGDNGNSGNVYIHHNVIDNSTYQRGGGQSAPKVFGLNGQRDLRSAHMVVLGRPRGRYITILY